MFYNTGIDNGGFNLNELKIAKRSLKEKEQSGPDKISPEVILLKF